MDKGYIVIPDWMLAMEGIDVYETLILAVIYGHSQDGESTFKGSLAHLASKAKCSRPKVVNALRHLDELGLIDRARIEVNGVQTYEYWYARWSPREQGGVHHMNRCSRHEQGGVHHVNRCSPREQPENSICLNSSNLEKEGCSPREQSHAPARYISLLSQDNIDNLDNINNIINNAIIQEDKEKIKKENEEEKPQNPAKFDFRGALKDAGVSPQHVDEWMSIRKLKKAVNSRTAFNLLLGEAGRAGLTVDEAVTYCIEESWKGFRASYVRERFGNVRKSQPRESLAEHNRQEMQKFLDMIGQEE